ncbi:hypothetical protein F7R91_07585 [Streptomyces luteolifulvus]|jgi:hypothetical protein|uniref:Uncharacterized protein n=1 Tax=Streptomyces luteolifulvus TaxID=2615112 RepID=A0A6H9V260_9ACTN|nr:hypothetical protein [Streptomyces luteolifulvus]KAB1148655.1 hypothetical protein F7R91_07585 [Streptomyces luteolifulvus]
MIALVWSLIGLQLLVVGLYAYRRTRLRHRGVPAAAHPVGRTAIVLVAVCAAPLPALLTIDAPVAAWGLWGVGYTAAALVLAFADASRDIPSRMSTGTA